MQVEIQAASQTLAIKCRRKRFWGLIVLLSYQQCTITWGVRSTACTCADQEVCLCVRDSASNPSQVKEQQRYIAVTELAPKHRQPQSSQQYQPSTVNNSNRKARSTRRTGQSGNKVKSTKRMTSATKTMPTTKSNKTWSQCSDPSLGGCTPRCKSGCFSGLLRHRSPPRSSSRSFQLAELMVGDGRRG